MLPAAPCHGVQGTNMESGAIHLVVGQFPGGTGDLGQLGISPPLSSRQG